MGNMAAKEDSILSRVVIGQEAVVPGHGLGPIKAITKDSIRVEPYIAGYPMDIDPKNVKPVEHIFVNL